MTDVSGHEQADDRALLAAHVAGDTAAFGTLVDRHADRLWAVALRTLGDPDEAADAVQDALVKAYRHAGTYRGDAAVTTWLHRIVVNACLDRVRSRGGAKTVPVAEVPDRPDPADAVAAVGTRLDVEAALAALPFDQRVAVVLVDVLDRPLDEVAATLEVPVGTVKSRASRGRARLAVLLGHLAPAGTAAPPAAVPPTTSPSAAGGDT